jgi:hypothetical protein
VIERVAAKTWCFDTTTYSAIADDLDDDVTLEGSPIAASWDPQLAPAMTAKGVAIHEERAMPVLLEYLKTRMSS